MRNAQIGGEQVVVMVVAGVACSSVGRLERFSLVSLTASDVIGPCSFTRHRYPPQPKHRFTLTAQSVRVRPSR